MLHLQKEMEKGDPHLRRETRGVRLREIESQGKGTAGGREACHWDHGLGGP